MRLAARTIGIGVPAGDFVGCIGEVHARACLVAVANGAWVTLLAAELGSLPCGIAVGTPPGFCFQPMLAVGAEVAGRGGVLRVADGVLAIDLRGARPWRSNLSALCLDIAEAPAARRWRAVWSAVREDGRGDDLRRIAGDAIDALAAATRALDATAAERAMARLIGLGEGRTPAGDDFLVGYFAALRSCRATAPRRQFAVALGARLKALSIHANRVSRLYLEAAADGEVAERLYAVAACIATGSGDADIGRTVAAALAVGHSSGAAGLLGLLHGCAALSGSAATPAPP